jgi:hypothetical protein
MPQSTTTAHTFQYETPINNPSCAPVFEHNSRRLTALTSSPTVTLTEDEVRQGCVLFEVPTDFSNLDCPVVAVCRPVGPWQWAEKGKLCLYQSYEETTDDLPGFMRNYITENTKIGKIRKVNEQTGKIYIDDLCDGWVGCEWEARLQTLYYIVRSVEVTEQQLTQPVPQFTETQQAQSVAA